MNKKLRKNLISAVITVAILAAAFVVSGKLAGMKKSTVSGKPTKKERRKVVVSQFAPSTAQNTLSIDGRLLAHDRVNVTSKVQGLMLPSSKRLREGMYVQKGDLIFDLDRTEAEYTVKAQRSALMTTITQMMPDLKFDYPDSFDHWYQYLQRFDIDQPLSSLPEPKSEQEKLFVSGRGIFNQYYSIKSQETRLGDYSIRAPFSGVVTAVNVTPGALVSPGQSLATMINTSTYEMRAPVALSSLKYVDVGDAVDVYSDDLGKSWKGRVARVGTTIDPTTQNIPLYISVSGRGLKDGMYLRADLKADPLTNVTAVPRAIFKSPTSLLIVEDSTIVSKDITPVKRGGDTVYVRGLAASDRVVSGSLAGLLIGQKVTY